MTLQQIVQDSLTRAKWCRARRKNSTAHYHEAALTGALILARQNQSKGCHYSKPLLAALRIKRAHNSKPRDSRQMGLV